MIKSLCGKLFEIRLRITGLNIARQLEKIAEAGIIIKDVKRIDISSVSFTVANADLKKIRNMLPEGSYKIVVLRKKGLFYFFALYKKRYALIFGIVVSLISLAVLSQRVFVVRVHGASESEIIKNIAVENGILDRHGNLTEKVFEIENKISESNRNIVWNTVEVKGIVADIFIKEGTQKEESEFNEKLVASKDCVIKNIVVNSGTATVSNGDVASKGQTLIDGKVTIGENEYSSSAVGTVYASVFYVASEEVPLSEEIFTRTGNTFTKTEISLFGLNVFSKKDTPFEHFETECEKVNTGCLPIGINKITYYETAGTVVNHNADNISLEAQTDLINKLKAEIPEDANIFETKTTVNEKDGNLQIITYIETIENVAIRG